MVFQVVFGSIVLISILSGIGALFLGFSEERMQRITPYLISLSAGSIFGGVFIHLAFKLANKIGYDRTTGLMILLGMIGSLLLERLIHWHCHSQDKHIEAFSYVLVAGDAVHNVLDGILIASSFLAGISSGVAATVAVALHKVPKEAGDFGVLVDSGFSRMKALGFNVGIGIFALIGAGAVLLVSGSSSSINALLLPLVVGNFVYIAGSDLLPRFKTDENLLPHLATFTAGVLVMYAIPYVKALIG